MSGESPSSRHPLLYRLDPKSHELTLIGPIAEHFDEFCVALDERILWQTEVGKKVVSTVFLGFDHSWGLNATPELFETMVFDAKGESRYMRRCATWVEAERQHWAVVAYAKRAKY
jgi:hypothetical protein